MNNNCRRDLTLLILTCVVAGMVLTLVGCPPSPSAETAANHRPAPNVQWERMPDIWWISSFRTATPDGWMVVTVCNGRVATCTVHDPNHQWAPTKTEETK